MLKNVLMAGCFSHDPTNVSQYSIFNWHEGEDTTAVTSGEKFYGTIFKIHKICLKSSCLHNFEETLNIFNDQPLDLEFAITKGETLDVWLLQVTILNLKQEDFNLHLERLNSEKRLKREFSRIHF